MKNGPVSLTDLMIESVKRFEARCDYTKGRNYRVEIPLPGGGDLSGRDANTLAYLVQKVLIERIAEAKYEGFPRIEQRRRIQRRGWTLSLIVHLVAGRRESKAKQRYRYVPASHRIVPLTPWRPGT